MSISGDEFNDSDTAVPAGRIIDVAISKDLPVFTEEPGQAAFARCTVAIISTGITLRLKAKLATRLEGITQHWIKPNRFHTIGVAGFEVATVKRLEPLEVILGPPDQLTSGEEGPERCRPASGPSRCFTSQIGWGR